jgi:hypothetical protein
VEIVIGERIDEAAASAARVVLKRDGELEFIGLVLAESRDAPVTYDDAVESYVEAIEAGVVSVRILLWLSLRSAARNKRRSGLCGRGGKGDGTAATGADGDGDADADADAAAVGDGVLGSELAEPWWYERRHELLDECGEAGADATTVGIGNGGGGASSVADRDLLWPVSRDRSDLPSNADSDLRWRFLSGRLGVRLGGSVSATWVTSLLDTSPSAAAISTGTSGLDQVASFSRALTTIDGRRAVLPTSSFDMGSADRACCVSRIYAAVAVQQLGMSRCKAKEPRHRRHTIVSQSFNSRSLEVANVINASEAELFSWNRRQYGSTNVRATQSKVNNSLESDEIMWCMSQRHTWGAFVIQPHSFNKSKAIQALQ